MKINVSWVRILSTTQILSVILFFSLGYITLDYLVRKVEISSTQNLSPPKMEVILLPQSHLTNKDDCVDVVITKICDNKGCQYHVTSFNVLCEESLSELP